ncbi:hypothetical protein LUZ63_016247 [Rhynchospora breviuscula]|uniref:Phospholipid scramblase n=1 Tax=Rhynchospora breviuscula TaxID=2022672 RepID=A0A9Q0C163_9POAL|nr:hypothetical protein LUZ63_016247 [Rhynchospora breviuscula]
MRWGWCLRNTSSWLSPSSPSSPSNEILRALSLSLGTFPPSDSRHLGSLSSGTQGKGTQGKGQGGSSPSAPSSVTRDWLAQLWKHQLKQLPLPARNHSHSHSHSHAHAGINLDSLLSRNNLVIARDIEWANVFFAFEQESRYVIMDAAAPDSPVGYIRETSNVIYRQLLRSRRPFVAHIIDSHGNEIFRVRRPFWLINSTIFAEVDGKEIGVVHRRWHLWRRIYDLYLGNRQFAVVENPGFWNWTFTLKDEEDNVLAEIDRNWRGIGFELFTDAGQYVIRFGASVPGSYGSDNHIEELNVVRPLTLSERAVALALAVSLDCDYFSRRGGWGLPIIVLEE